MAMKPHVVCLPYPSQGHISPVMQLAKILHSRGFHITFVNTEFTHRRLVRSLGPDSMLLGLLDFRFETIPDGLTASYGDDVSQDLEELCRATRWNCLGPFKELLMKLNSSPDSEVPPVSCILSDGFMSFSIQAAKELGIPEVQFWTASACGFMAYLHFTQLQEKGLIPFEGQEDNFIRNSSLDTPIDWIPGMPNVRLKDMPSFIRNPDHIFFDSARAQAQDCLKSSAIIFNTFDELEQQVLDAIAAKFPNIYTIGPVPILSKKEPAENQELNSLTTSLWKEDFKCLEWLDQRDTGSVVYVNFGSIAVISNQNLTEFAWGLANSKRPFLWVVRPDIVTSDSAILPEEFYKEIKGRGLLTSWCKQEQVLTHPSVAVFLTHCGWNSILESIAAGVPVMCWPFFAEQQTNCRYACTTWGIGSEIDPDVRRSVVAVRVEELMGGEKGKQARLKALEWKMKAEKAVSEGGSSYQNFERFIKEKLMTEHSSKPASLRSGQEN